MQQSIAKSNRFDLMDKVALVSQVVEMFERGQTSTGKIMEALQVSRPTALKYKRVAMQQYIDERKPMNRENIRQLEIGRVTYWIENISEQLSKLEPAEERYIKLLGRLREFGDQLHRITGINIEHHINEERQKRIVFVYPQASNPNVSHIEGEIVTPTTTANQTGDGKAERSV